MLFKSFENDKKNNLFFVLSFNNNQTKLFEFVRCVNFQNKKLRNFDLDKSYINWENMRSNYYTIIYSDQISRIRDNIVKLLSQKQNVSVYLPFLLRSLWSKKRSLKNLKFRTYEQIT